MGPYTVFDLATGSSLYNASASAPALSLQDAFLLNSVVFLGACSVASSQTCTDACLDASMMFCDLEIFHNCLTYPAVAGLHGNGSLGDPHLADSLGIHNQSQALQTANNISTTIYNCLSSSCGENKQCTSDLQRHSAFYYGNNTGYVLDHVLYPTESGPTIIEFDICKYVAPFSFLNADIGGVGVGTNPV